MIRLAMWTLPFAGLLAGCGLDTTTIPDERAALAAPADLTEPGRATPARARLDTGEPEPTEPVVWQVPDAERPEAPQTAPTAPAPAEPAAGKLID